MQLRTKEIILMVVLLAPDLAAAQGGDQDRLTESQESRIRQEEIFRREVQIELARAGAQPQTFAEATWALANRPFGLWLLSTVVVGFISWGYRGWRERRQDREFRRRQELETESLVRRLDLEIAMRLQNFERLLAGASDSSEYHKALMSLERTDMLFSRSVFTEFENRPVEALVWELMFLLPESWGEEVYPAFEALQYLANERANLGDEVVQSQGKEEPLGDSTDVLERVETARERIGTAFRLLRWDSPIRAHRRGRGTQE